MADTTSEPKSAVISVGKALLGVSFATLAAVGGASGVGWIAAVTAVPGAVLGASDSLKPLVDQLRGKKEDILELPIPQWWSSRNDTSWQDTCTSIEGRLPAIILATAERLKKEVSPTTPVILDVFTNEIERQIPMGVVFPNERGLMADCVAKPFLERVAAIVKSKTDPIRMDALIVKVDAQDVKLNEIVEVQKKLSEALTKLAAQPVTPDVVAPSSGPATIASAAQGPLSSKDLLRQKWQQGNYDVFICYHPGDTTKVKEIDSRLKNEGILPWFDVEVSDPAQSLLTEQSDQIKKIKSAAVFIGEHAVADWQASQIDALLNQFAKHKRKNFRVIPVFLKDAPSQPEMSVFLENFAGVDFRQDDPDPFARLLWGITGVRPPII